MNLNELLEILRALNDDSYLTSLHDDVKNEALKQIKELLKQKSDK